jgi:hypothetical protein
MLFGAVSYSLSIGVDEMKVYGRVLVPWEAPKCLGISKIYLSLACIVLSVNSEFIFTILFDLVVCS